MKLCKLQTCARRQFGSSSPKNVPISVSALPLLNNPKSGAGQGRPSELLRYSYQEVTGDDGGVSKFHVLPLPLAAILDAAFQQGVFPDEMKASVVSPVFNSVFTLG